MTTRAELAPLFTDLPLSADDAGAIVAALRDIARVDGEHAEELELIKSFVESLDLDLGATEPTVLPAMSPDKLAVAITDPVVRKLALQCGVLLAWADGALSDKERSRLAEYSSALGFSTKDYDGIEKSITAWVKSGDFAPAL